MTTPPAPRYSGRDVFISYSRKNSEFAEKLADVLTARGRDVWIDQDDIPPSAEWWDEIKRGIDAAHTFVPILTPESLSSPVCTFEMNYAIRNHKRIIPIMRNEAAKADAFGSIAAVEPSGFLAEILGNADLLDIARDNWLTVEKLNWLLFRETDAFEPAIDTLLSALDTDLERVRLHTRLLTRAHEWDSRGRDAGYLLVEGELREAASWLTVYGDKEPKATDEQRAFVQVSLENEAAREAARQRQIRQLRIAIVGAVFAGLLALLAGGFGVVQTNTAQEQQRLAGTAVRNAAAADTRVGDANIRLTAVPPVLTLAQNQVVTAEERVNAAGTEVGAANRQLATATQALITATSIARQAATGEAALNVVNTQVADGIATVTEAAIEQRLMTGFANTVLLNQDNPARQIAEMNALVEQYPDQATVYQVRGLVYYIQNELEFAIADYDEALRLNPQYSSTYFNRANAYADLGNYEQALADYDEALRLNPQLAVAFSARADVYRNLGDYERALADYNESFRLGYSDAIAYTNRAIVYQAFGDYERAILDYDEAIRLDPTFSTAYYNRASMYHLSGKLERAIEDYDEAIRLDPNLADAYTNRGIAYYELGDNERALADYAEAIRLAPQIAEPYANRGLINSDLAAAETDPDQQLVYLAQTVADFRQAEALGLALPADIADYVAQSEAILAAHGMTPEATPDS